MKELVGIPKWILYVSIIIGLSVLVIIVGSIPGWWGGCNWLKHEPGPTEPVLSSKSIPAQVPETELLASIDSNAAPDLIILGNDSTCQYDGWCDYYPCDICGGLRAGDWGLFGDSTRYSCPIANVAVVPPGGDSTKYAYIDTAGYHPGLITVAVFYDGKRYDGYVSKTSYDFGNTNCLPGNHLVTWTHPLMGISVGCLDRYDPNFYSAPFTDGDLIVIVVWVNKPDARGRHRIKEQRYDNNVQVLPLRRDSNFYDVKTQSYPGWVLDWTAMTKANVPAIKRWIKKS